MTTLPRVFTAVAAAALIVPAAAGAHGSVFETVAKVQDPGSNPPTFSDQKQYLVTNHGYTYVVRESNGVTDGGMINYKVFPSAYRKDPAHDVFTEADTGAQPHATCREVEALDTREAKRDWQVTAEGGDPFYAYVPFQKGSAGLEDDPGKWNATVKRVTGVDLAATADADVAKACTDLGGMFTPADTVVTTAKALAAGETAPLTAEVKALGASVAALQGQIAALGGQKAAADAQAAGALADAGRLRLALRPLKLSKATVTSSGLTVPVSGPAGAPVTARLLVTPAKARRLALRSRVLGRATGTLDADGTTTLTVKLTAAAAKAVRRAKGSVPVTVDGRAGDRASTTSAVLVK